MEHCTVCHQTFSGSSTGDAHRVGDFAMNARRCLADVEMQEKGWRKVGDVWRGPAMTDEQLARRTGATS